MLSHEAFKTRFQFINILTFKPHEKIHLWDRMIHLHNEMALILR